MKKFGAFLIATGISCLMSISAMAGQWQQSSSGWWWQNDDGSYPINTWQWIDGNNDGVAECYYFDENGYILVNGITPDGCMVDSSGAWIVEGEVQTKLISSEASQPVSGGDSQDNSYSGTGSGNSSSSSGSGGSVSDTVRQPIGDTVFVSRTGKKYHRDRTCGTMKDPIEMSLQDAINSGRTACAKCF